MSSELLRIDNINYAYRQSGWRLRDVSLTVSSGEIVGIIGPNGAGKSTLLKIAAGLLARRVGQVSLLGKDIVDYSRRQLARELGYLPQNVQSTFDYCVEEVVAMGRFAHLSGTGFLQAEDLAVVQHCLDQTETTSYRSRGLAQLSGGERQRVLLASVLAQQPKVLLLDEPTTGLDLHHQVTFFSLLRQLAQRQMAVVVVTHDLNLAGEFCQRLLLLSRGQAVKEGDAQAVIRQDVLEDVYRQSVYVGRHPLTDKPMVLPLAPEENRSSHREDTL